MFGFPWQSKKPEESANETRLSDWLLCRASEVYLSNFSVLMIVRVVFVRNTLLQNVEFLIGHFAIGRKVILDFMTIEVGEAEKVVSN